MILKFKMNRRATAAESKWLIGSLCCKIEGWFLYIDSELGGVIEAIQQEGLI